MPTKHTIHVALTDRPVRPVRGRVADGVRLALETLIDHDGREATGCAAVRARAGRRARV